MYPTFLCRVHDGDRAEGPLASVVVCPHFDVKRREGWDGVISEDVTRRGCGDNRSRPRDRAHRPEGDDVAEALSVLQFLGHRLGAKHKTIVILKRIQTKKQTGPSLHCASTKGYREQTQPLSQLPPPRSLHKCLLPYLFFSYVIVAKEHSSF